MKTLFLDLDNVITDFLGAACDWFNDELHKPRYKNEYSTILTPDDITDYATWKSYHLPKGLGEKLFKEMFDDPDFWQMAPIKGALNGVKNLCKLYDTYIVTAPVWNDVCVQEKGDWIKVHLPFFELDRLIFARDKSVLFGDILVDDYWQYLLQFNGKRVLFTHRFNQDRTVQFGYSVSNWVQLEELLSGTL